MQSPEFRRPLGQHYTRFLDHMHAECLFDWYLEVGCRSGRSLSPSRSRTIGVDPYFQIEANVIGVKPALHIFQTTSDAFFASGFLKAAGIRLSFAFLDGMHLVEYLLRDFMAAEAASAPGAVIALHDMVPSSLQMTTRDLANLPRGSWTGDVWKLLPILQRFRPDLKITVLDAKPTGLVLVSNLDAKSRVLPKAYDAILGEYRDLDLNSFGVDRFFASFDFTGTRAFAAADFPDLARCRLPSAKALSPQWASP
jgi:hypothetical protein